MEKWEREAREEKCGEEGQREEKTGYWRPSGGEGEQRRLLVIPAYNCD